MLYIFQRNLLYFPSPEYDHSFDTFELRNQQEVLKVTKLNPGQSQAILYFGGNAEPVIFNAEPFLKNFSDYTIYLHDSISLIGRSLGSGVATYLASNREVSHLALVTPYDSIKNVAQARFPIFPINLLIKDKYDSAQRAAKVSARVLIVMAELDLIIPNSHSIKLSQAFSEDQVSTLNIQGSDHNNVSFDSEYFPALVRFFSMQP